MLGYVCPAKDHLLREKQLALGGLVVVNPQGQGGRTCSGGADHKQVLPLDTRSNRATHVERSLMKQKR